MMPRRYTMHTIGVLAAAVTACGTPPPKAPPTDSPGAAAAQPSPTAPVSDSAYWTSLTLSDRAFGPIQFGMKAAEANAAVGGRLTLPATKDGSTCEYARAPGAEGLSFMIDSGRIARVDVRRPDIRTAEGAGIGDTEERIKALYPRTWVTPHKYTDGHYLTAITPQWVDSSPFLLVFETDGHKVTEFRAGTVPQVQYVEGCS